MTIWKFPLKVKDVQQIEMPQGTRLLSVQVQRGIPCLWALVDEQAPREKRLIVTYETGHYVHDGTRAFVGTYQIDGGELVFHVFDGAPPARPEEL